MNLTVTHFTSFFELCNSYYSQYLKNVLSGHPEDYGNSLSKKDHLAVVFSVILLRLEARG